MLRIDSNLAHLDVSFNSIGDDHAEPIARVISINCILISLEVCRNKITVGGCSAIAH
jgi:hypothetical protein